ncbi:hypothetical protein NEIPOLOT_00120, partial [Neisseria polysaccharea ATCC 43768]
MPSETAAAASSNHNKLRGIPYAFTTGVWHCEGKQTEPAGRPLCRFGFTACRQSDPQA